MSHRMCLNMNKQLECALQGFVGPRGDKGERGEPGEKGRDGSQVSCLSNGALIKIFCYSNHELNVF